MDSYILQAKECYFVNVSVCEITALQRKFSVQNKYVIVISQYEWVILVITWVQGKAEDEGNN